jgi:hypothetical protein
MRRNLEEQVRALRWQLEASAPRGDLDRAQVRGTEFVIILQRRSFLIITNICHNFTTTLIFNYDKHLS